MGPLADLPLLLHSVCFFLFPDTKISGGKRPHHSTRGNFPGESPGTSIPVRWCSELKAERVHGANCTRLCEISRLLDCRYAKSAVVGDEERDRHRERDKNECIYLRQGQTRFQGNVMATSESMPSPQTVCSTRGGVCVWDGGRLCTSLYWSDHAA